MKKRCSICNIPLKKDEVSLCIKLFGKHENVYCLGCLAEELEVSIEDLKDKIEEYKADGCSLFM